MDKGDSLGMNATHTAAALAAMIVMMGVGGVQARSEQILVNASTDQGRQWSALTTNEVSLDWDWNWASGSVLAQLTITGTNGTMTTNFTSDTSSYVWRPFSTAIPSAEDVYDVSLTFFNATNGVVSTQTAQLAVVLDPFGQATIDLAATSRGKVKDTLVVPYDKVWTNSALHQAVSSLVINQSSMVKTNTFATASGYYGWKVKNSDWSFGQLDLALSYSSSLAVQWTASLFFAPYASLISLR